jgi:hypothetical protein
MRPLAVFSVLEGVLNVATSLALVHRLGILGVAIGTAAPAFLVRVVLMPLWACRQFGLPWGAFTVRVWLLPLLAGLATAGALRALADPRRTHGWPALLGLAAACAATYWVLVAALRRLGRGLAPRAGSATA